MQPNVFFKQKCTKIVGGWALSWTLLEEFMMFIISVSQLIHPVSARYQSTTPVDSNSFSVMLCIVCSSTRSIGIKTKSQVVR